MFWRDLSTAIASIKEVNVENGSFHVESTSNIFVIGLANVMVVLMQSLHILSPCGKFQELLPILTSQVIQTKHGGNLLNMCVRKVLSYGSETWPVVTEDVQQLVTADSGMIRWICV